MGGLHSPKLQHYWNLNIRLFSVISRTLIGGGLTPLQRSCQCILQPQLTGHLSIYIYIYVCVCVCVCVWFALVLWHIHHCRLFNAKSSLNTQAVLFRTIQFSISTQFISIWPIDRTLSGSTTSDHSGPGSDGNKGLFHILQSSTIKLFIVISGHSLGKFYPSPEMQSVYSADQADLTNVCVCSIPYKYAYNLFSNKIMLVFFSTKDIRFYHFKCSIMQSKWISLRIIYYETLPRWSLCCPLKVSKMLTLESNIHSWLLYSTNDLRARQFFEVIILPKCQTTVSLVNIWRWQTKIDG